MKVTVLGNGGFGTAMALVAHRQGHDTILWGFDPAYTAEIAATRRNPKYLEGAELPEGVAVTSDAQGALDAAEVVLLAIPTQHLRGVLEQVGGDIPPQAAVVSLAKGLEQNTAHRPTEIVAATVGGAARIMVLSGPSHAEELARGLPATLVIAGGAGERSAALQAGLSDRAFRVYRNEDPMGVELCGALKNVMALAAGIADGLGFGDNAKAAILARGIAEMCRYGVAAGARAETFFGIAGVGDLAVTAFSRHGRNRAFGERIGKGETLEQVLSASAKVAEGVWTSRVVRAKAQEMGVEMPLTDAVCRVLFEAVPPLAAVGELMERDHKPERPMS